MVSVKDFKNRDLKKGISGRVFGPSFRRTGPSSIVNIFVVTLVGVVSGNYIFGEPLRQYWEEQAKLEAQAKEQGEPIPAPRRRPAD